jgi:prevent-host-death family protein
LTINFLSFVNQHDVGRDVSRLIFLPGIKNHYNYIELFLILLYMTIHVSQQEAEQQFSQLLDRVIHGEEIIISAEDREIARLIPAHTYKIAVSSQDNNRRKPGIDEGRFVVPDDFDDPLPPDILKTFKEEN